MFRTKKDLKPDEVSTESNVSAEVSDTPAEVVPAQPIRRKRKTHKFVVLGIVIALLIAGGTYVTLPYSKPLFKYYSAVLLFKDGRYEQAAEKFKALGNYKDSTKEMKEANYLQAKSLVKDGKHDQAAVVFEALGNYKDSSSLALAEKYIAAQALLKSGDTAGAAAAFKALGNYKDSASLAQQTSYSEAETFLKNGDTASAAAAFESAGNFKDAQKQAKMLLAPDIAGLTKQIQNLNGLDRVVYLDAQGNYEGEYKQEVKMGDKETGGVILKADMALKMSNEQKPSDASKWLGALPVDLSDMKTLDTVNIEINTEPLNPGSRHVKISVGGNNTVGVVNTIPGSTTIWEGVLARNGFSVIISKLNFDSKEVISGQEAQFISIWSTIIGDPFAVNGKTLNYGDKMGDSLGPVLENISCFNSAIVQNESFDNIAKINGCPIFVEANGK
jgi:TolA-binding protein